MKVVYSFKWSIVPALMLGTMLAKAEPLSISVKPAGTNMQLSWPSTIIGTNQLPVFPEYQVQYSSDLGSWRSIAGKLRGIDGRSGPLLNLTLDKQASPVFYRLRADLSSQTQDQTGDGGAEVFGYDTHLASELQSVGQLSVEDFATNSATMPYVDQLSWDPTTAQFWSNFDRGFRLSTNESAIFMTNGFVVSERLGSSNFGDAYYWLFNADVPTFVTADSVLHAWHRSYQSMLEELEEVHLSTLLAGTLSNMSLQLPRVWQASSSGPLKRSILDADYFLTVARSLWSGQKVPSALGDSGVEQQVILALNGVSRLDLEQIELFGSVRTIDFSQFKVRGHYDASERLRRYFQTMMWCGRTDLRLTTFPPIQEDDIRQLGTAVVLKSLLTDSGQFNNWSAIEQITRTFVGTTDSMTFAQLQDLLAAAGIGSPGDVTDLQVLTNLQTRLLTGELGVQSIHSDFLYSPLGPEQIKLPRSFTFSGQKFVMDSWAFSQMVFDRILWKTNDMVEKIIRRKPSCLDVAFSVFGNDQTVPEIVARILDTNGVPFRDGLPYQQNLLAVRKTIDSQDSAGWTNNIYNAWLAALRALSGPTTDPQYPEAMRTRPWAMKTLNTQLASWTELRHDTLLYAKQSYTEPGLCGYPAGFVEPRPEFWRKMKVLADITAKAISSLHLSGYVTIPSRDPAPWSPSTITFDLAGIQGRQVWFLQQFSAAMTQLQAIAEQELAQQPLTPDQTEFMRNVVEDTKVYTGLRQYNGWYPQLFYANGLGGSAVQLPASIIPDPMVADVHTDLPDPLVGDPGAVLHEAIGNVNFLLIAIDNGPDRMVYAGPVLSHYEFEMPAVTRLSDSDWNTMLSSPQRPRPPDWTESYLVPQ